MCVFVFKTVLGVVLGVWGIVWPVEAGLLGIGWSLDGKYHVCALKIFFGRGKRESRSLAMKLHGNMGGPDV